MAREAKMKTLCYFDGDTVATVAAELQEYGPGARLFFLKKGSEYFVQVKAAAGEGGDPNNNSHPCPGSPGC